jgi:hypothetical protein
MRSRALTLVLCIAFVGGCAKYEYNLVKPPDLARHIGTGTDAVVTVDPLEYRLRTVDNRLVMRIFNSTEDAVELLGPKCSVVDPEGQSHPLRSQSIAPGSFIKLILPPPRPRVYDPYYGPTIGVGVGVGGRVDAYPYSRYRYYDPYPPEPRYLAVYDENDVTYWDWRGEGECRVVLTFRRGEKEFRHEFLFRRQKLK